MINWIKSFFVSDERIGGKPKCKKCGLGAFVNVLIEFQTLDMEEMEEKILTRLCYGCIEDIHIQYNPEWIPEPITRNKNE